ncbi:chemotaxis protein, partial [Hydrogenophaga sp. XSHU_21]
MKFNRILILAFVAPAVLFVAALGASILSLTQTQTQFDRYIKTEQAAATGLQDMYAQGLQMGQALRNIVLDPANPQAYKNFDAARAAFDTAHKATLESVRGTPLEQALLPIAALRAEQARAQEQVLTMVKSSQAEAVQVLNAQETPAWRALRVELLKLVKASSELSQQTHADVNADANRARLLSLVLAGLAVAVAAGMGVLMYRTVCREIGGDPAVARHALQRMADGDLSGPTPESHHPGSLVGSLATMQTAMSTLVG